MGCISSSNDPRHFRKAFSEISTPLKVPFGTFGQIWSLPVGQKLRFFCDLRVCTGCISSFNDPIDFIKAFLESSGPVDASLCIFHRI